MKIILGFYVMTSVWSTQLCCLRVRVFCVLFSVWVCLVLSSRPLVISVHLMLIFFLVGLLYLPVCLLLSARVSSFTDASYRHILSSPVQSSYYCVPSPSALVFLAAVSSAPLLQLTLGCFVRWLLYHLLTPRPLDSPVWLFTHRPVGLYPLSCAQTWTWTFGFLSP